jgi:hypothetical protein
LKQKEGNFVSVFGVIWEMGDEWEVVLVWCVTRCEEVSATVSGTKITFGYNV